uniref:Innexin n=1 Tax=Hydra vulgaris TaxID=6087 RepID=A0A0H5FNA2_HYDVU|nr:Innexin 3 [Hydra vulgaris]
MAFVASDLKNLFKIKFKARYDPLTDRYNRMFMVKLLMACTIVTGLNWYADKVHCIVSGEQDPGGFKPFASSTCWIQGLYVYKEMRSRIDESSYYGIPKDMDYDGLMNNKVLCPTESKLSTLAGVDCVPMKKTFYLQYQWMPFYLATLAVLYYFPYFFYKTVNSDLIELTEEITKNENNLDKIIDRFFPYKLNTRTSGVLRLTLRQLFNLLIKLAYVVINFLAFFGTNSLLHGDFKGYGKKWLDWTRLNNTVAYDYMGVRDHPKPGNELLPPFGYCELYSSSKDIKASFGNQHKLLCEISPHILYQYVFVVLWFGMVLGMVVSIVGLIISAVSYAIGFIGINQHSRNSELKKLFNSLCYREIEYLELLRKKNISLYSDVLLRLKDRAHDTLPQPPHNPNDRRSSIDKSDIPMYPIKRKGAPSY